MFKPPYDLVIRRGTILDGTGEPGYTGDVAVKDGRIAGVGKVEGCGREEIDAADRLVTPGFVDIHTHYDGHVTWSTRLSSSSQHGVTTVLMGNCGVGFAPCRPKDRHQLVHLMEGIEDMSTADKAFMTSYGCMFEFDGDYEPGPLKNLGARAAALGTEPITLAYDTLTAGDGGAILYLPAANFAGNDIAAVEAMISHKHTILGLGDAGAHLGFIFDASMTSYMIERWSNVERGTMPIEWVVKALTRDTAQAVELNDRGIIATGYRADLNVIDPSRFAIGRHQLVFDLPAGGKRLHQSATGYDATMIAGELTYRKGVATGALPGRLVRRGRASVL